MLRSSWGYIEFRSSILPVARNCLYMLLLKRILGIHWDRIRVFGCLDQQTLLAWSLNVNSSINRTAILISVFNVSTLSFSQIKVDCIIVSTIPVKAVIDDHIQRLFDALLNSLRRGISNDVTKIDTFLNEAMETLSRRPQTVEEIGDANAKHSAFKNTKKEASCCSLIYCIKLN